MKKSIKLVIAGLLAVPALAFGALLAAPAPITSTASAACDTSTLTLQGGADCAQGSGTGPTKLFGDGGIFTTIVNVLLFIIGAISVIMLIYGGIRYTISGGDTTAVTAAKNTILYAIVGIIIAVLAYAIVNFVLGSLIGN